MTLPSPQFNYFLLFVLEKEIIEKKYWSKRNDAKKKWVKRFLNQIIFFVNQNSLKKKDQGTLWPICWF